jgi:hypothetical protein
MVLVAFYINNILDWWDKYVVKRYQKCKTRKEREEKENANRREPIPPPIRGGKPPQTKKADARTKPSTNSQLLRKLPWKRAKSNETQLPQYYMPSDIEAGKRPGFEGRVEEKPAK